MTIAIRVDASLRIGTGHFARCLTLANALKRGGADVLFVCRHITESIPTQIRDNGHALALTPPRDDAPDGDLAHSAWLGVPQSVDAADTLAALKDRSFDWLVVDHYGLDARWEKQLRPAAAHLLALDDIADRAHDVDLLLDQNLQSPAGERYDGLLLNACRRLIGPRFALLRPEFRAQAGALPVAHDRLNIFFGGIDPDGMTLVALEALADVDIGVDVIVGADNPHRDGIAAACGARANTRMYVQPRDMAGILACAALALGAGGATSWERCCLGLPTLIVSVADNQRAGTEAMAQAGVAVDLGPMQAVSPARITDAVRTLLAQPDRLAAMSDAARALVDGRGAERVALHMLRDTLQLHPAQPDDCELAWRWRNSPSVRAGSFDTSPFDPAQHATWWADSLQREDRVLLIGHCQGQDVGVLRFDQIDDRATVSIYVDPELAGLGLGRSLLRAGEIWLQENRPAINTAIARIRSSNQPSLGTFAAAGYRFDASDAIWTKYLQPKKIRRPS